MMHVLVFPGWYPSKVDKLTGDFIQRHMYSIARQCRVSVVFPVKDPSIKERETVTVASGNLTEVYHYYPSFSSIRWVDSFLSFICYNYYCIKTARSLHKQGKINLVHLYVLQKNQLLGFALRLLFNISYVVSEQSTLYVDGRFDKMDWAGKEIIKWVFKHSLAFHAVSGYLLNALKNKLSLSRHPGVVIPNVVDAELFFYNNRQSERPVTFVHVSNMVYQKNVEGMLQAFAKVRKETNNFLLNLVGPLPDAIRLLIEELELTNTTKIWNERNYRQVAEIMQKSSVFVFFTRHETFGCVIIEANACGLPVIVTDLEVTREVVTPGVNGVFVESENVDSLAEKILQMINNRQKFDPITISQQTRNKYNYDRIGGLFIEWYNSLI